MHLRDHEDGFTLSEVLVAMMVLSLALAMFFTTLASVQRSVVETDIRTRSNTQARLALQTLDHEVRSGNVLYDPATSTDPSYRFKIYTQTNADHTAALARVHVPAVEDHRRRASSRRGGGSRPRPTRTTAPRSGERWRRAS